MATLEKIRSKSVLLVVIIAVALLAFILGDLITNGRNLFGTDTTVAKVGKEKIDIQEYHAKNQELSQSSLFKNSDSQVVSHMVLDWLVSQKLMDGATDALDYKPSKEFLRYYMIENPSFRQPEMTAFLERMQQNGLPVEDPAMAYAVIFQPEQFGLSPRQVEGYQQGWLVLEQLYSNRLAQVVFLNTLQDSFKANDLDVAAMKRDYVTSSNVSVAKKPFSREDLEKYEVKDEDLKKAYDNNKAEYKVAEPTKEVSLIAYSIYPSAQDLAAASELAISVQTELANSSTLSKESRKEGVELSRKSEKLSDVRDNTLKTFLEEAVIDEVVIIDNNRSGFRVGKVTAREERVDSATIAGITIKGNAVKAADVLAYANSGAPIDSVANKFPGGDVTAVPAQELPLYVNGTPTYFGFPQEQFETLFDNMGNYIILDENEEGAVIAAITKKSSPKGFVDYELASYSVVPSDATINSERERLQAYINENNTAEKFAENAMAAGYNAMEVEITPSDPALPMGYQGYYPDSRSVVRWVVIDGKDGEVSRIYQNRDLARPMLYAVGILDSFDEYMPADNKNVKERLTDKVRREKAGQEMAAKYNKSTLGEAAEAMGVDQMEVASLQSTKRDMTVSDNKVKGRILGSKPSQKVQVVSGDDGVYAFIINEVSEEPVMLTDQQFADMFINLHRFNPGQMLRSNQKIENNIYKFEQGE